MNLRIAQSLRRLARTGLSSRFVLLLLLALLAIHLSVLFIFEGSPTTFFGKNPLSSLNYSLHFYQVKTACTFMQNFGSAWGYDPHYMAGYPMGTLLNVDNKFTEIFSCALAAVGVPLHSSFNLYVLTTAILVPFLMYRAGRNFEISQSASLLAATLSVLVWHLSWVAHMTFMFGIFAFAFASYLMIYCISRAYIFLRTQRLIDYVILATVSIIASLIHSVTFLLVFLPFSVYIYTRRKSLSLRTYLLGGLLVLLVIVANSFWLRPLLRFIHIKTSSAIHFQGGGFYIARDLIQPYSHAVGVRWLVVFFGLLGIYIWRQQRIKDKTLIFLVSSVWLMALAYFGYFIPPIREIEPWRNVLPATYLLTIPAAVYLLDLRKHLYEFKGHQRMILLLSVLIIIPVAGNGLLFLIQESSPILPTGLGVEPNNRIRGPDPEDLKVSKWIQENTSRESRIMVESWTLSAMLGSRVKREFIGGPFPWFWIPHNYANFYEGKLLDREITEFTSNELFEVFENYNVGWVIAGTDETDLVLSQMAPTITFVEEIEPYRIFKVNLNPSYFLLGEGNASADYNTINVSGIQSSEIVLKYHFLETLRVPFPMEISRFPVGDDPVGFIHITNINKSSFSISNGY